MTIKINGINIESAAFTAFATARIEALDLIEATRDLTSDEATERVNLMTTIGEHPAGSLKALEAAMRKISAFLDTAEVNGEWLAAHDAYRRISVTVDEIRTAGMSADEVDMYFNL